MKITEQLENEIATRLNLTKPIAPQEVKQYIADGEALAQAVSNYNAPQISWRADTAEVKAVILKTRHLLTDLEELAEKVDSHSDTIRLATTAHQEANRKYWHKIETEENKPRNDFKNARDEFINTMEKEIRSLKRKQNKAEWASKEREEITTRLELVGYMIDQARYCDYNPETAPEFTEQVLWEQITKAERRATAFLNYVYESSQMATA
jgi:predicted RNase H-like nuclease (RuvC/YqgF family)